MKVLRAAVVVALLAGPAYGQEGHVQRYGEEAKPETQVQINANKAAEKAYRDSLSNIPDAGPVDPWGNARGTGAPKEAAKTAAKPAAKTAAKTTAPVKPKTATTAGTTTN